MDELKYLDLHGDRIAYRDVGSGETLLLIHGMAGSSETWRAVIPRCPRNTAWWRPTCWGTVNPQSLGATTRWARLRCGCVTCSTSWV